MFAALDEAEMVPGPESLEESRAELRRRLVGCDARRAMSSVARIGLVG